MELSMSSCPAISVRPFQAEEETPADVNLLYPNLTAARLTEEVIAVGHSLPASEVPPDLRPLTLAIERVDQARLEFCRLYESWLPTRTDSIASLRYFAQRLNCHHRRLNIAKITGASVGLTGGTAIIGGLVLAPMTAGVSLILTAGGTAATVAGGVTALTTSLTEQKITRDYGEKAKVTLEEDTKMTADFQPAIEEMIVAQQHLAVVMRTISGGEDPKVDALAALKATVEQSAKVVEGVGRILMCLSTLQAVRGIPADLTAGLQAAEAPLALSAAAAMFSGVLTGLSIAVDILVLVTTSKDIHKGSKAKYADQLSETADKLDDHRLKVKKVYEAILSQHCTNETTTNEKQKTDENLLSFETGLL